MSIQPAELQTCFQGIVPSLIATSSATGEPNVTYLSQVQYVDPRHVALSCQFFNKTTTNIAENPYATIVLYEPVTLDAYRMRVRYVRSETEGPLFDTMAMRIQVIASHTGMTGVFRLLSADVYEVLSLDRIDGFLLPPDPVLDATPETGPVTGPLNEIRGLQLVSERLTRAPDLATLCEDGLKAFDEVLGFAHSMILLADADGRQLVTVASRGYANGGVGVEVAFGQGLIGTVAERRRLLRVGGMGAELRYGRAVRERIAATDAAAALDPELPLPGIREAQAQLALPLLVGDRLLGVLAVESPDPLCFDEWDEAFLQVLANQYALGIERLQRVDEEAGLARASGTGSPQDGAAPGAGARRRRLTYFPDDDCIFVDDEYLVRNLPGRILWKLLQLHDRDGRREFSNRELRLDPGLGLPPIKDNLESRLILLRRRLAERCPDIRLVPIARGRFALELACQPVLRVAGPDDSAGRS